MEVSIDIPPQPTAFERAYHSLRTKEQRIYTDEELKKLPNVPQTHRYVKEWLVRKQSSQKLIAYLKKKEKPLKILEIGCGNAWLASKLATIAQTEVIGIDPNSEEINQGQRNFKRENLKLKVGDFETTDVVDLKFDIILFAASLQYFASAKEIIAKAQRLLLDDGEIHLLDTKFYTPLAAKLAKERTQKYFETMGSPEMCPFYFHHQLDELISFNYHIKYHPKSFFNRLFVKNPFYWILIRSN